MKAIYYERFGGPEVLRIGDVRAPRERRGWARLRVEAVGLNPKDVLVRKGKMRWLTGEKFPRIPGYDVAGTLIDGTRELPAGTPVFGMIQSHDGGACAETALLRTDWLAARPKGISAVDAAGLPLAGLTALQALRDELGVREGERVLLNGASGGVGTLAIQIARALGAEVIAVCSEANRELVTRLGAARVIDYSRQSVAAERDVDHVFDIFGNLPWSTARSMLGGQGRYCTTVPRAGSVARGAMSRLGLHRASLVVVRSRRRDLELLARWVEEGRVVPVVDRVVPWEDSRAGHAYLETKRARGKVVVELASEVSR